MLFSNWTSEAGLAGDPISPEFFWMDFFSMRICGSPADQSWSRVHGIGVDKAWRLWCLIVWCDGCDERSPKCEKNIIASTHLHTKHYKVIWLFIHVVSVISKYAEISTYAKRQLINGFRPIYVCTRLVPMTTLQLLRGFF